MSSPKVSIIIPTLNRAYYLKKAIISAISQDYDNLEIVIMDNNSSDNTYEVVREFLHLPKVKYFKNKITINATKNFNTALMFHATGDYVLLLSDDDALIDSQYITKAMNLVKADPEVLVVFANYRRLNLNTRKILSITNYALKGPKIFDGKYIWFNYWRGYDCPMLTTVYSRQVAVTLGGYFLDTNSRGNPVDFLLVMHLLLNGKAAFIPDVVAEYGIHDSNSTSGDFDLETTIYGCYLKDLEHVRVVAQYAKNMGLNHELVDSWQKRIIKQWMGHLVGTCLDYAVQGENKYFKALIDVMQKKGEIDYLYELIRDRCFSFLR